MGTGRFNDGRLSHMRDAQLQTLTDTNTTGRDKWTGGLDKV